MFMVGNCNEEIDEIEILVPGMLYRFLPNYRFLYQNIYIHFYFCNIIFLLCFSFGSDNITKKINKNTYKILSVPLK